MLLKKLEIPEFPLMTPRTAQGPSRIWGHITDQQAALSPWDELGQAGQAPEELWHWGSPHGTSAPGGSTRGDTPEPLSPPSPSSQAAPPELTQRPRCLMQQSLQGEGVLRRKSGRAQVLISCLHLAKTKPTVLYMHSAKSDWRLPWGPSGGDSKLPSQGPQLGLWTKEPRSLRAALPKH